MKLGFKKFTILLIINLLILFFSIKLMMNFYLETNDHLHNNLYLNTSTNNIYDPFLRVEKEWFIDNDTQTLDLITYDINNDNISEIISVGYYKNDTNQAFGLIRIWNFSSNRINLINSTTMRESSNTRFRSIEINDVDDDGVNELIIVGDLEPLRKGIITIWNYTDKRLQLEAKKVWVYTSIGPHIWGVVVNDFDNDTYPEIVTLGSYYGDIHLNIWNFSSNQILNESQFNWNLSANTLPQSIISGDINNDGVDEIIIGGRISKTNLNGFINIVKYSNGSLDNLYETEWEDGDTEVLVVKLWDFNNDTIPELICGGYTTKESPYSAMEMTIWKIENNSLNLINETYWYSSSSHSRLRDLEIVDFDNDSIIEILSGGYIGQSSDFRIWNFTDNRINLEASVNWDTYDDIAGNIDDTADFNLLSGDFDSNNIIEVLTSLENKTAYNGDCVVLFRIWDANNYTINFENFTVKYDPINQLLKVKTKLRCTYEGHGYLNYSEVKFAIYSVKKFDGSDTGLTGTLIYDFYNESYWSANIDVSSLSKGVYYIELSVNDWHTSNITTYNPGGTGEFEIGFNLNNLYNLQLINSTETISNSSSTYICDAEVEDMDGDGIKELIIFSRVHLSPYMAQLQIWNLIGKELILIDTFQWNINGSNYIYPRSIEIGDITGDNNLEIVCGSYFENTSGKMEGLINVFNYSDGKIKNVTSLKWYFYNETWIMDLKIGDVDNDETNELVIGGLFFENAHTKAIIAIWNISNNTFLLENVKTWIYSTINDTSILKIDLADIDLDNYLEIIIGGSIYIGKYRTMVYLTVYNYSNNIIINRSSALIINDSYDMSLSDLCCDNVDNDSLIEIIVSFKIDSESNGSIGVFNFTKNSVNIENYSKVYFGTLTTTLSVCTGDLDNDNYNEIILMGFLSINPSDAFFIVYNKTKNKLLKENFTCYDIDFQDTIFRAEITDINNNGIPELITFSNIFYTIPISKNYAQIRVWIAPFLEIKINQKIQDFKMSLISLFNISIYSYIHGIINNTAYYQANFKIYNNMCQFTGINGTLNYDSNSQSWYIPNINVSTLSDGIYYTIIYFEYYDSLGYSHHIINDSSEFTIDITKPYFLYKPNNISYNVGSRGNIVEWTPFDLHPGKYFIYVNDVLEESGFWNSNNSIKFNLDGFNIGTYTIKIMINDSHSNIMYHQITLTVFESNIPSNNNWIVILIALIIIAISVVIMTLFVKNYRTKKLYLKEKSTKTYDQIIKNIKFLIEGRPYVSISEITDKIGKSYNETEELIVSLTYKGILTGFIDGNIFYNEKDFIN
ncbi:MAG: FG-GAP repeat domain-containing protein [Candidatus Helarchaeota archaeon]